MRRSRAMLLFFVLTSLSAIEPATAQRAVPFQGAPVSLQLGTAIERTIASGQTHTFSVRVEADQYLQLVVDQRGIDVVVRLFSPAGKSLGEFDSPNGDHGPENVSLVADTTGLYRIDITPLDQVENAPSGRYEIKILELRHATDQELQAGKNREVLKAKGLALLLEVIDTVPQVRLPQTRVRAQVQSAQLLWGSDEKRASKLIADAIDGVKEYLAKVDADEEDYYQSYAFAMELRQEGLHALAPHDPEMALSFLRSTRTLIINPDAGQNNSQQNQELQLEIELASQITAADPKRAFQIAEDSLKKGYSYNLLDTLARLRTTDAELAAKLTREIAAKLKGDKLLRSPEAAMLAVNLLRFVRSPSRSNQTTTTSAAPASIPLLSEQEYRDLFQKTLAEGLSYSAPPTNNYSPERNAAQNILNSFQAMSSEMEGIAPGSTAAVEKKTIELNTPADPQGALWQQYQKTINSGSLEAALEAASQAPPEMRDQLYQQVAAKAAGAGDFTRARQILMDHISNPLRRRQALNNINQQAIFSAVGKGKVDEALRNLSTLRTPKERAAILSQIVGQIGPGQKRTAALNLLELARSLLGASVQAEDQEQMNALLEIGRAFSRYDLKRGFEVVEPLIDQFNELSAAAVTLNGFGQKYYEDGEMIMQNGNSVANIANQLVLALGTLSLANFERAKAAADRVHPPEVRIAAYLAIAQHAIQGEVNAFQPAEAGN